MYTEGFDQWLKTANKNLSAPLGDLSKASTEMWRKTLAQNLEIMSDNLLLLSGQLQRFTTVKKPEDYFNVLKECVNEDINTTVENSQKLLHTTVENIEEYVKSCGSLQESTIKAAVKEKERQKEK